MKKGIVLFIFSLILILGCEKNKEGISQISKLDILDAKYLGIKQSHLKSGDTTNNLNTINNLYKIIISGSDTITTLVTFIDKNGNKIYDNQIVFNVSKIFEISSDLIYLEGEFKFTIDNKLISGNTLLLNSKTGKIYSFNYYIDLNNNVEGSKIYIDKNNNLYFPSNGTIYMIQYPYSENISISQILPKGQVASNYYIDYDGNCFFYDETIVKLKLKGKGISVLDSKIFPEYYQRLFFRGTDNNTYYYGPNFENNYSRDIFKVNIINDTFSSKSVATLNINTLLKNYEALKLKGYSNFIFDNNNFTYFSIDDNSTKVVGAAFYPETKEFKLILMPSISLYESCRILKITKTNLYRTNIHLESGFPTNAYIITYDFSNFMKDGNDLLIDKYQKFIYPTTNYDIYSYSVLNNNEITFSGMRYSDLKNVTGILKPNNEIEILTSEDNNFYIQNLIQIGNVE